ncbi:MAG: D-tyrosyl-tRNA(Tyr) deacylase [Candidatus Bathyarchaeota archaeon]|nr:MAG: D-tyrosyl-tRNA(Tyr) deacylase [Candidatus Bathyarchaeota archaeon]
MNIKQQLLTSYRFKKSNETFFNNPVYHKTSRTNKIKLVTINEELIHYQNLADNFDASLIIYLSRHSSKSGTPTLSVHAPGNLAKAKEGGITRKISIAPAKAMKKALLELMRQKAILGLDYQVTYESTHHGPSLDVPSMFVELGSSQAQWEDLRAAEAVAHASMAPICRSLKEFEGAVGIGGPHYNNKFTEIASEGSIGFGHIIPKYAIPQIDSEMIKKCIERTVEEVDKILLDWKGIRSTDKKHLAKILAKVEIQTQKV